MRLLSIVTLVTLAWPVAASAQEPPAGTTDVRFAPGIVRHGGVFGDDSPEWASPTLALTVGIQVRTRAARRTGFSFEATLDPVGVRNPHFDETLHSLYLLAGAEIGRRTYVRPGAGIAFQMFSGAFAAGPSAGLAFGVAVGRKQAIGERMHVSPEFVARASASPGAGHWMIGVQVPIGWR
jgi:hypothetical protein